MTKVINIRKTGKKTAAEEAVKALSEGGLVVFPTETLYGIGADATNQMAIDKLLRYKARREGKPLSIAVSSVKMAEEYVEINKTARNLYENFLPGPITVVSKSRHKVARGVESETGTLGIRIPDHPLVLDIVSGLGRPITATSANASYKKRPYKVSDVLENISEKQKKLIDLILDAGELPKREPSTVVDTTLGQEVVLRQGDIKLRPIMKKITNSAKETRALGGEIFKKYTHYLGYKSVILALEGELGAGKTEMVKGVAKALGIKEAVSSPTFIIEKEYKLKTVPESYTAQRKPVFYHIDTWRLRKPKELEALGFVDQVEKGNVFAIEWADKVASLFERVSGDAVIIWVKIEHGEKENRRRITVGDYRT